MQVITKYNSSVKYSPSPNFNDFLKDISVSSASLRDTFLALITLAEGIMILLYATDTNAHILNEIDSRDSPNDAEIRRKLMSSANAITEKVATFKKLILDETKGLRPQLRLILYQMLSSLKCGEEGR